MGRGLSCPPPWWRGTAKAEKGKGFYMWEVVAKKEKDKNGKPVTRYYVCKNKTNCKPCSSLGDAKAEAKRLNLLEPPQVPEVPPTPEDVPGY